MAIRAYRDDDHAAVVELWFECGLVAPQNNPERDIERKLAHDPEGFLVGEHEGRVVATCMVGYDGHRGWINYLAVSPAQQGRGWARAIMEHAEEILSDAGCAKINLQVRASNRGVVTFYERIGFKVDDVLSLGKRLVLDDPYKG